MTSRAWAALSTPVGQLSVVCSEAGLTRVYFRGRPPQPPAAASDAAVQWAAAAREQLAEYFSGQRRVFSVPIDWSPASRSQRQVLGVLFDSVGFGETVTYGGLAHRAESGQDGGSLPARAIGQLMGSNPYPVIVPCHRVVAGDGLGGFSGGTGPETKRWLLIFEGALPPTLDWAPAGPPS